MKQYHAAILAIALVRAKRNLRVVSKGLDQFDAIRREIDRASQREQSLSLYGVVHNLYEEFESQEQMNCFEPAGPVRERTAA